MRDERRRNVRSCPRERAFAALGWEYTKVGKIIDISMGGLAFSYIVGMKQNGDVCTVDIFLTERQFHLHNLPCRIVYDYEIDKPFGLEEGMEFFANRRCGIQFASMERRNVISFFIDTYAIRAE